MRLNEANNPDELREWREGFVWLNPLLIDLGADEPRWEKITRDDARRSLIALRRLAPYVELADIEAGDDGRTGRQRLASLKDASGAPSFNQDDLDFYDLYFGSRRIIVNKVGDTYTCEHGRHRIWQAQQQGEVRVPVMMRELVIHNSGEQAAQEENGMSGMELRDIENEANEQHEQVDEMKNEIEQHKERAEKLEDSLREIRATAQEVGSEALRNAEASAMKAQDQNKQQLKELKERRDKMLEENKQLADEVLKVNGGRRRAQFKAAMLESTPGASDEFRHQVREIHDSLSKDLADLAHAEDELHVVRQKLEALNV